MENARKFIDPDLVVIKLAISIFALSENSTSWKPNLLTNSIDLLKIQSKYAEILWKYLLYKYGHASAVRNFLNLTLFLVTMNNLKIHAQDLANHQQDVDSIIEHIEIEFIIHDTDDVDLI